MCSLLSNLSLLSRQALQELEEQRQQLEAQRHERERLALEALRVAQVSLGAGGVKKMQRRDVGTLLSVRGCCLVCSLPAVRA